MSQHTRYRLVEVPTFYPGADLLTRGVTGPFVDTGFDIPLELVNRRDARVYLSVDTIRELAQTAGILSEDALEAPDKGTNEYLAGYKDATEDGLSELLVDISDRLRRVVYLFSRLDPATAVEPEAEPGVGEATPVDAGADEQAGDPAGEPVDDIEPSTSGQGTRPRGNKRPARLSGNTGDGAALRI